MVHAGSSRWTRWAAIVGVPLVIGTAIVGALRVTTELESTPVSVADQLTVDTQREQQDVVFSANDDPFDDATVNSAAENLDVTPAEARTRLERQNSLSALADLARVTLAERFGGSWIDHEDGGRLYVATTADAGVAREELRAAGEAGSIVPVASELVEIVEVQHSYDDLLAAYERLTALRPAPPELMGVELSERRNSIVVLVGALSSEERNGLLSLAAPGILEVRHLGSEPSGAPEPTSEVVTQPELVGLDALGERAQGEEVTVTGSLYVRDERLQLCQALEESDPPACSGGSVVLEGLDVDDLELEDGSLGVRYGVERIALTGRVEGDRLVVLTIER